MSRYIYGLKIIRKGAAKEKIRYNIVILKEHIKRSERIIKKIERDLATAKRRLIKADEDLEKQKSYLINGKV